MSTTGAFLDASGLEYFYDGIKLQFADKQYELKVDVLTETVSTKADSATTLAGYGITDASISNGTITLGANTITPLTSSDVTSTYSSSGTAPVNGQAINSAIGALDVSSVGGSGMYIKSISEANGKISATAESMDTTPTSGSAKAITSGAVFTVASLEADDRVALAELIDGKSKNLVNTLDAQGYNYQGTFPTTIAGVTYTRNADGSITTSGSTSATRVFKIPVTLESGKVYTISGCPSGGSDNGYRVDIRPAGTTDVTAIDYGSGASFTAAQTSYDFCIRYPSAKSPAETFKMMVCVKAAWDISHNYVQYAPSNLTLSDQISTVSSTANGKATITDVYGVGKNIYAAEGNTKDLNSDTYKAVGRYYAGTSVTKYVDNKPLPWATTSAGFQLTVEYNGATNRLIQTVTYNTTEAGILGCVYKRWYTSSGWSTWFKYEGTAVS